MLFSSFLHIPTLFLLSASTVLADTEALVFTRPLSLPPRPTVTNYQLLGRSPYNLTANASPGTNLLYHFLQENDTSLKTDIGLSYACPDVGGGVKWMYKLSWLAQPATHISISSSSLEGADPTAPTFNPLLHLDISSPPGGFKIAETLEPMLWGWMPLSVYPFAEVLVGLLTATFLLGIVGIVVGEAEELGEKVEKELWAAQQKKVE